MHSEGNGTSLLAHKDVRRLVCVYRWSQHLKTCLTHDFEAPSPLYERAIHRGVEEGRNARHQVWLANRGLVRHIANKIRFRSASIDKDALVSYGEQGLAHAIDKFDPNNGAQFSTYADHWIRSYMYKCVSNLRDIRLPINTGYIVAKIGNYTDHECVDTRLKQLGVGKSMRKTIITYLGLTVHSLDNGIKVNSRDANMADYHDIIPDQQSQISDFNLEAERIKDIFEKSGLDYVTKRAVYLHLGIAQGDEQAYNFADIARKTGYTGERIRQKFNHAILYIRSDMKILVIDPGATTGYILYEPDTHTTLESGELKGFERLDDLIDIADFVIYENFQLFGHKAKEQIGSTFPAVEVIGVVKYLLGKSGKDYIEQRPADQQFFDDKKLARLGMKSKSRHVNSATKHLLHYLKNTKDKWLLSELKRMLE